MSTHNAHRVITLDPGAGRSIEPLADRTASRRQVDLLQRWAAAASDDGWGPLEWAAPAVEAVADALLDEDRAVGLAAAAAELAATRASTCVPLEAALDDFAKATRLAGYREPPFAAVKAFASAWAEASLKFYAHLTCQDPTSGLSTIAHLNVRLSDLYRESIDAPVGARHVLVVVQGKSSTDTWVEAATRMRLGACLRTVFSGGETLALVGPGRAVALATRDEGLSRRLSELGSGKRECAKDGGGLRIWLEPLPDTLAGAVSLVEELSFSGQ